MRGAFFRARKVTRNHRISTVTLIFWEVATKNPDVPASTRGYGNQTIKGTGYMTKPTCSTPECTNAHYGRGWCKKHYHQAWKAGNVESQPRTLARPTDSIDTRLRNIGWTVTESGCWEWNGSKNQSGYGTMAIGSTRPHIVSRMAYQEWVKVPDPGTDICHTCDNPPCMNPAHLFEGTRQDNVTDMVNKRRVANGERKPLTCKLTDDQVSEVRVRYAAGGISQRKLAADYGVSQQLISHIIHYTRRKHNTFWIAA